MRPASRSRVGVALFVMLAACATAPRPTPTPTPSAGSPADALWALAPARPRLAIVLTPRALALIDRGAATLREVLARTPALTSIARTIDAQLAVLLGGPSASFSDLGIDPSRGAALFLDSAGDPVIALAIRDRARVEAWLGRGRLGALTCGTVATFAVCASSPAALAALGHGVAPPAVATVGARGDLEIYARRATGSVAIVGQLDRGELVLRGVVTGVPSSVTRYLGAPHAPRLDPAHASGFAVMNLAPIADYFVAKSGAVDHPLADLARAIRGPLTILIDDSGAPSDTRIAFDSEAHARWLVDNCAQFVPPALVRSSQPGLCQIQNPWTAASIDLWTVGKELRTGSLQAFPTGATLDATPLGTTMAGQTWSAAVWGRGTAFAGDPSQGPPAPPDAEGFIVLSALFTEAGVGVRVDGDTATFVVGARTIFTNPEPVVQQLLAIPPAEMLRGEVAPAIAVVEAAPTSPFARDFRAGYAGMLLPSGAVGLVAGIVSPLFVDWYRQLTRAD
ncbi:MAG: hypothetical protein K8W52_02660 [Deltaproteobacteria bacterium]|nr:hypothetical protein [Deltaproteobacteria bacterium]